MKTLVVLDRFMPFKQDSARRIDRVIDYFGEPLRRRARRDERSAAIVEMRSFQPRAWSQSRRRIDSGVSVTLSLSARTR